MDAPTIQRPVTKAPAQDATSRTAESNNRLTFADDILAEIPRLRRYAFVLLRDQVAADDLVQDSLERALSRQKLFHRTH